MEYIMDCSRGGQIELVSNLTNLVHHLIRTKIFRLELVMLSSYGSLPIVLQLQPHPISYNILLITSMLIHLLLHTVSSLRNISFEDVYHLLSLCP